MHLLLTTQHHPLLVTTLNSKPIFVFSLLWIKSLDCVDGGPIRRKVCSRIPDHTSLTKCASVGLSKPKPIGPRRRRRRRGDEACLSLAPKVNG